MRSTFQDLQDDDNPNNGLTISDSAAATSLLNQLFERRPAFMCQFTGDNGSNLIVGIGQDKACAQYSSNDGMPPYLMAISAGHAADGQEMEFLVADTLTPIDGRYRIPLDDVRRIVTDFVTTGQRSGAASWEELK